MAALIILAKAPQARSTVALLGNTPTLDPAQNTLPRWPLTWEPEVLSACDLLDLQGHSVPGPGIEML